MGYLSGCLVSSSSVQKLWNLLSIQMIFWWICGGESSLPVLFLHHLRTTPPPITLNIKNELLSLAKTLNDLTPIHLSNILPYIIFAPSTPIYLYLLKNVSMRIYFYRLLHLILFLTRKCFLPSLSSLKLLFIQNLFQNPGIISWLTHPFSYTAL